MINPFNALEGAEGFGAGAFVGIVVTLVIEDIFERIELWKKRRQEKKKEEELINEEINKQKSLSEIRKTVIANMENGTTAFTGQQFPGSGTQVIHQFTIPTPHLGTITIPVRRLKNGRFAKKPKK